MEFLLPRRLQNSNGDIRRVGFEIEFGGVDLKEAAQIIIELYGGKLEQKNRFSLKVVGSDIGDFDIESDARFLSQDKYSRYLEKVGLDHHSVLYGGIERVFDKLSGTLLPFEIAMPPLPMNDLRPAERIRQELHSHSALGTRATLFSAFGMQFNPEVPDFSATTILSYIRAFFLLYDWLHEVSDIVLARKIAPYIHSFPEEYVDLVLNPRYEPSLDRLIRDYLRFNPTRNRPLDFLPLFTYLDKELVQRFNVERDLIKARPTFHYRLPNSEVDDPRWSFAHEWNKWVKVEDLAGSPDLIHQMSLEYFDTHAEFMFGRSEWVSRTREWLNAQH